MLASTLDSHPVEAVFDIPPMRAGGSFDVVSGYVERVLKGFNADGAITDSVVSMLKKPWHAEDPNDAAANQQTILQAVSAVPDSHANSEAISKVTGTYTDPLVVAVTDILQDIAKPPELSRRSQSRDELWLFDQRIAIMPHVRLAKIMVELSALPAYRNGGPFRQLVADALGEHHGRQPEPSLRYGCGHLLGGHGRRIRDAVSASDWFGAKFYRENRGNCDELGRPLSYEERSRQYGAYLLYLFGGEDGYRPVSEKNNAWQAVLGVYEATRNNHPSKLTEPEQVFDGDLRPAEQHKPYINVVTYNFRRHGLPSVEELVDRAA